MEGVGKEQATEAGQASGVIPWSLHLHPAERKGLGGRGRPGAFDGADVLWGLLDSRFPQKEQVDELGEVLGEVFALKVQEGETKGVKLMTTIWILSLSKVVGVYRDMWTRTSKSKLKRGY